MGSYKCDDNVIIFNTHVSEPSWSSMNSQTALCLLWIHFLFHNGKCTFAVPCLISVSTLLDSIMKTDRSVQRVVMPYDRIHFGLHDGQCRIALLSCIVRLSKKPFWILLWKIYIYYAASNLTVFKNIHNGFHYGRFLVTLLIRRLLKNPLLVFLW